MSQFLKPFFILSIFLLAITTATTTFAPASDLTQELEETAKRIIPILPSIVPNQTANHETAKLEFLNFHNKARKHAHLPLFVWDIKLEQFARNYVEERSNDCNLIHSDGPYGENLFWGAGNKWRPKDAVKLWVKEHKYYNYKTNQCKKGKLCGHYTQIVWRDSIKLGCALGLCTNGDTFGVCSYDPPGNYLGELPFFHYEH